MSNSFLHPKIIQISDDLKSGKLQEDKIGKSYKVKELFIPPELLSFVKSHDLNELTEILETHPMLYSHPIVRLQVEHLRRLCWDEAEWDRQGWQRVFDEEYPSVFKPPEESGEAYQHLIKIIKSYVAGVLPEHKIVEKKKSNKRGRNPSIKNPTPTLERDSLLLPEILYDTYKKLHEIFSFHQNDLQLKLVEGKKETKEDAKARIKILIIDALNKVNPSWSLNREVLSKSYSPKPKHDFDLSEECTLGPFGPNLNFDDVAEMVFTGKTRKIKLSKRLQKAGNPSYLAYAVLGKLLDVTPDKIHNTIDTYQSYLRKNPPT